MSPNYTATAKKTNPNAARIDRAGRFVCGIVKRAPSNYGAKFSREKGEASEGIEPPYKDLQSSA